MFGGVQEARISAYYHKTGEDAIANNRREVREEEGASSDYKRDTRTGTSAAAHQSCREDGRLSSPVDLRQRE